MIPDEYEETPRKKRRDVIIKGWVEGWRRFFDRKRRLWAGVTDIVILIVLLCWAASEALPNPSTLFALEYWGTILISVSILLAAAFVVCAVNRVRVAIDDLKDRE